MSRSKNDLNRTLERLRLELQNQLGTQRKWTVQNVLKILEKNYPTFQSRRISTIVSGNRYSSRKILLFKVKDDDEEQWYLGTSIAENLQIRTTNWDANKVENKTYITAQIEAILEVVEDKGEEHIFMDWIDETDENDQRRKRAHIAQNQTPKPARKMTRNDLPTQSPRHSQSGSDNGSQPLFSPLPSCSQKNKRIENIQSYDFDQTYDSQKKAKPIPKIKQLLVEKLGPERRWLPSEVSIILQESYGQKNLDIQMIGSNMNAEPKKCNRGIWDKEVKKISSRRESWKKPEYIALVDPR